MSMEIDGKRVYSEALLGPIPAHLEASGFRVTSAPKGWLVTYPNEKATQRA